LDEIAWLFNLRGSDVECNPVFYSYAIVTLDKTALYVDPSKLSNEVLQHLGDQITIKPYDVFFSDLKAFAIKLKSDNKKLLINSKTSLAVEVALQRVRLFFMILSGKICLVTNSGFSDRTIYKWAAHW
jgi:Xaa-Pro aminopeptidase